jgi:hypothetical protein
MSVPVDVVQGRTSFAVGTPATLITGGTYFAAFANQLGRTYDVSPDGARFLRIKVKEGLTNASSANPQDIIVVQGWFEELKRLVPTK